MRFWLVQPELKYWFCEKSEGHFVGMHLHGAQYFGGFKKKRYDGYLAGGGFTYGRRAPASIARSAEKTNIRTISGLPKQPCH